MPIKMRLKKLVRFTTQPKKQPSPAPNDLPFIFLDRPN